MPLGFGRRSTLVDYTPYIRYSAMGDHGGTWSDKDRTDIFFSALADLEFIRTGWLLFESGMPPDLRWDAALGQKGRSPGKGYKRGVSLRLFFPDDGVGLRELVTNNAGVCAAISKVYDVFEHATERALRLVPLVECVDVVTSETNFGTIYDPVLEITDWQPRPQELAPPTPTATSPAPTPSPSPPTTTTTLALGHNGADRDLDDTIPF